jgi:hypothetical protein
MGSKLESESGFNYTYSRPVSYLALVEWAAIFSSEGNSLVKVADKVAIVTGGGGGIGGALAAKLTQAGARAVTTAGDVLEPAEVADVVLKAIDEERFLILPHPRVLDMYRQKATDYDRWLRGMRRYQRSLLDHH